MTSSSGPHTHNLVYWILWGAVFWIGVRWFERVNLYFPSRILTAHPGTYGLKYDDLRLRASDGPLIHGWFIERDPKDPVVLFCHGNGDNISIRLDKARILRKAGASVLLFDYRGYGQSSGSPTEQGTYRDAEAAYEYLTRTRGVSPDRIVIQGESLGCAVAVELALRHKPRGLIIESPFTSIVDMGKEIFPWLPVEWIVRFRYDNLAKIGRLQCPLLIMHSPQDDIVPFKMGRRLFEAAREPKTFFEMRGSHNSGFMETGKGYEEALRRFLNERLSH